MTGKIEYHYYNEVAYEFKCVVIKYDALISNWESYFSMHFTYPEVSQTRWYWQILSVYYDRQIVKFAITVGDNSTDKVCKGNKSPHSSYCPKGGHGVIECINFAFFRWIRHGVRDLV